MAKEVFVQTSLMRPSELPDNGRSSPVRVQFPSPPYQRDHQTPVRQKVSNLHLYIPHAGFDTVQCPTVKKRSPSRQPGPAGPDRGRSPHGLGHRERYLGRGLVELVGREVGVARCRADLAVPEQGLNDLQALARLHEVGSVGVA